MKKTLLLITTFLSISFAPRAAMSVMLPGPTVVISLASCAFLNDPVDNGPMYSSGFAVLCPLLVPVAGASFIYNAINIDSVNPLKRLMEASFGLILLNEDSNSVELEDIDLNNLPNAISREEALAFNENREELSGIIEEVAGHVTSGKPVTPEEIVELIKTFSTESEIPQEAVNSFFKIVRQ